MFFTIFTTVLKTRNADPLKHVAFSVLPCFAELFSGSPKKRFFVIRFVCYGRFVKRLYLPKNLFWGE